MSNNPTPEPTAADLDELALAIGEAATEIVSNIKTPNEIARLAMFDELVEGYDARLCDLQITRGLTREHLPKSYAFLDRAKELQK